MSEDRTQAPSKLRIQQARDRGLAAFSPELTSAAALAASVLGIRLWGADLARGLLSIARTCWSDFGTGEPGEILAISRSSLPSVFLPLVGILGLIFVVAVATHTAQTRGLWTPSRLVPDLGRLWSFGREGEFSARIGRGLWTISRTIAVLSVAAYVLINDLERILTIGLGDIRAGLRTSGEILAHVFLAISLATLALGIVDWFLRVRAFERMLRVTPEEHREDLKAVEGDPALRSRRRSLARSLRNQEAELAQGAWPAILGPGGLTVIVASEGGGTGRERAVVRASARGAAGIRLRKAAERGGLGAAEDPELARRLSRYSLAGMSLPSEIVRALNDLGTPNRRPE